MKYSHIARRCMSWGPSFAMAFVLSFSASADEVRLIATGAVGVAQLQHDMHSAQKSIEILTYIWDPCSILSKVLMKEMAAKVSQGIPVKLLVDAHTHDETTRRNFTSYTQSLGIELRYFNIRYDFNPARNFRMHAKLIVIDGKKYYSGGRNIADDYFDMAETNWIDRDVQVEGASARLAQQNFELLWNTASTSTSPGADKNSFADYQKNCTVWRPADEKLSQELAKNGSLYLQQAKTFTCSSVRPIIDDPRFMDRPGTEPTEHDGNEYLSGERYVAKSMTRTVVEMLASPQTKHIWIENFTYIPMDKIDQALEQKRQEKVPIEIYTNGTMDTQIVDEVTHYHQLRDSQGTEKIYGYSSRGSFSQAWMMTRPQPLWMIHSKVLVTGDAAQQPRHALVGSFNLDPRSYHTNIESGVLISSCPAFAKHVQESIMRLRTSYLRDQDCQECRAPRPKGSTTDKITAWLLLNFL